MGVLETDVEDSRPWPFKRRWGHCRIWAKEMRQPSLGRSPHGVAG